MSEIIVPATGRGLKGYPTQVILCNSDGSTKVDSENPLSTNIQNPFGSSSNRKLYTKKNIPANNTTFSVIDRPNVNANLRVFEVSTNTSNLRLFLYYYNKDGSSDLLSLISSDGSGEINITPENIHTDGSSLFEEILYSETGYKFGLKQGGLAFPHGFKILVSNLSYDPCNASVNLLWYEYE